MRETIEQYGSTIVVTVVTVVIIGILTGISIWGVSGLISVAGFGESELTRDDGKAESASEEALDIQVATPQVEITTKISPEINKAVALIDLVGTNPETEIHVENVYVAKDGAYIDAEDNGLCVRNKDILTFKTTDVFFVEVSIWETNRLSRKMARVNVEEIY